MRLVELYKRLLGFLRRMHIIPVLGYLFYLPSSAWPLLPVFRHTNILSNSHISTSMHGHHRHTSVSLQTPTFLVVYSTCNVESGHGGRGGCRCSLLIVLFNLWGVPNKS